MQWVVLLSNIIMVILFKLQSFFSIFLFSFTAIQAYYRRASANMVLGKFKASLKDYETVIHDLFPQSIKMGCVHLFELLTEGFLRF